MADCRLERTQSNGRAEDFGNPENLTPGVYLLTFDVAEYYAGKSDAFFPVITVVFNVTEQEGHYHVPVLLSAYGYSTYRGN
ncbi:hydroxyisourate hydrolase [Tsuneonella flava]|uniref:hydroxyisourate hydrolase n=1 Tax=Tsuneonella flava TaxID=2055955 RepID=UPI000AE58B2D|nr:hydroxyisourate hydrolase [Tsuneonella flava]